MTKLELNPHGNRLIFSPDEALEFAQNLIKAATTFVRPENSFEANGFAHSLVVNEEGKDFAAALKVLVVQKRKEA